ncbi:uncharacterized protein LOC111267614 [Varroa jacobsoni]|uniref:Uncharacterized protein n=1 Tax=Varroa destructor TaxID=109461 RepID=A0A7M7KMC1_VARDE|nr:uncharacterized protein LOC111253618 [Varroa destructor]XP_022669040.1 uncharacterized protein LOC111253618 [Varroa destructor]XP_022701670.1 uncharacterized protein LOC111267614 [Varroa jacobsoni]XP_022701671.1 uncharacterized protein LOC111267614 [Varroa jacobsoni]XP_022701672.1 uncharacterized protein LOC111267614 [Varroa jacobsoni]
MSHTSNLVLYRLYGQSVPHPSTLKADLILDRFPRPGIGRGRPIVVQSQRLNPTRTVRLTQDSADSWDSSRCKSILESGLYSKGPCDDTNNDRRLNRPNLGYPNQISRRMYSYRAVPLSNVQSPILQNFADIHLKDPGEDEYDDDDSS